MTFIFGMAVGVTIALVQTVHAQTNATVAVPISVPTLQFQPAVPTQQAQAATSANNELTAIISSIVVTAIGVITAKVHSDKKTSNVADVVKEVVAEVLKGKEVDKQLARVTYDMNPEAAVKINNAPAVKLATLDEDAEKFAEKAAKTNIG